MTKRKPKWRIEFFPKRRIRKVGGGGHIRQRVIRFKLVRKFEREVTNGD